MAKRVGAKHLLASFGASALITPFLIANISAAELPKELTLHCQGNTKLSVTLAGNNPDFQTDTFHFTLHLKDGSLNNVDGNFLEGENCALAGGIIRCELDTTISNHKEHRTVTINRTTGEMHLLLETQVYDGANTSGQPNATIKSIRTGVCRSATAINPIF
ncbi:MAG: hypothetical protein WA280_08655 [Xanthobacteraceae bacterium]